MNPDSSLTYYIQHKNIMYTNIPHKTVKARIEKHY